MRGEVRIPTTWLDEHLREAARLQAELAALLARLELAAGAPADLKPGHWRHYPKNWPGQP